MRRQNSDRGVLRRRFALAFLVGGLLTTAGYAQTLMYEHEGAPLFSITYPSGWLLDLDFEQEAEEAGAREGALRIVEASLHRIHYDHLTEGAAPCRHEQRSDHR